MKVLQKGRRNWIPDANLEMPPAVFWLDYIHNTRSGPSQASHSRLSENAVILGRYPSNCLSREINRCFLFPVLNMKAFFFFKCIVWVQYAGHILWRHINIYLIFTTHRHEAFVHLKTTSPIFLMVLLVHPSGLCFVWLLLYLPICTALVFLPFFRSPACPHGQTRELLKGKLKWTGRGSAFFRPQHTLCSFLWHSPDKVT